ncbi:PEGA domain-containing protein [Caldisericum sp.]|uniref:PEGA domain-containing protein n=1 Tax=Caldisericum sp. TaxID=2499687 RepID=UPI003D0CD511
MRNKPVILNKIVKALISFLIIFVILLAAVPLEASYSQNIQLPSGWHFSNNYQKMRITLKGTTYYGYQIEKQENNQTFAGWLIVDSQNNPVSEKDSYQKLALAATVAKYSQKLNELQRMEEEDKLLNEIKWDIGLFEKGTSTAQNLLSSINTIISNKAPTNKVAEDYVVSQISSHQTIRTDLLDNFLNSLCSFVDNNVASVLASSGELTPNLSETQKNALGLKIFSIIKLALIKGTYVNFGNGLKKFEQALNLIKGHSGAWSYEDASKFLSNYEEGESEAIAYGSWYLNLTQSSVWDVLWESEFKKVLTAWVVKPSEFNTNLSKWLPNAIKTENPEAFRYSQVAYSFKSISSGFTIYKWFSDTSLSSSSASKVYSAITTVAPSESTTGTLSITSTPSSANVYISGSYRGVTPLTMRLSSGSYTVEIKKDGYLNYKCNASIAPNKRTQIKAILSPILKKGTLHVITNPVGADILINGKLIGKSPLYFYEINEGTYSIQLKKEGYIDYFGEMKIIAGKNNVVNKTLTPKP